jgi:steroid delta-isomerase-like uncharacterized protein
MDERIEQQRRSVAAHFDLENAHQWDAVVASFEAANPAFELVPAGARLSGKEGITAAYDILATAFPDVQIQISHALDTLGCSVREVVVTGTHRGEYFGVAPSGRRVHIEIACFFLFDTEGRLQTERVYFDNASVFAQIRGESPTT